MEATTAPTAPVPSWQVTAEMLTEWGFPVREVDKVCGTPVVMREGMSLREAAEAAHAAGFTYLASMPAAERERQRVEAAERRRAERAQGLEVLAWFRETGRYVGSEGFGR